MMYMDQMKRLNHLLDICLPQHIVKMERPVWIGILVYSHVSMRSQALHRGDRERYIRFFSLG